MDAPLDQEAANADLISDIVAPVLNRAVDVSELARGLTSGGAGWREAWSVETQADSPGLDSSLISQRLSHDEDAELRRLNYLSEIGALAGVRAERLIELRLRDRRDEVRPPREFAEERADAETKRKWYKFPTR